MPGRSCSSSSTATASCRSTSSSSARCASRSARAPARGARMPSTRGLAAELGVSRGVVSEAYGQLAAEGYLTTSQGAPVRVATAVRASSQRAPARSLLRKLRLRLPSRPARPRRLPSRRLAALAAHGAARLAAGRAGLRRPARRAGAARSARRVSGPRARHGGRPRAHARVHRIHARLLARLPRAERARRERIALEDPGWHSTS